MFSSDATERMPQTKSERTRAALREIALRSFRERGYDETTIRLIAAEAGVSVGTTNYHFASKNHLVQELYLEVQERHRAVAEPLLAEAPGLVDRLAIVYRTGIAELEPYRAHAAEFVSASISPRSPINPLSHESSAALGVLEDLFHEAVEGSGHALPADIRDLLPRALVLAHLLLALFWVYDSSPDQRRTRELLTRGLALFTVALPFLRLPVVRGPLRQLLQLLGGVTA
ncbi:TetR family transcriptional regulator [Microbacterium sp. BWT-B31]|uniref:TetR/AcrR family transcriptional regulator n=1 Tax=Microbacterium sp. BWT-B31 TaxID=3232072 RepID=UPI0035274EFC